MQLYGSRLALHWCGWRGWQGGGVLLELENLQNVANCVKTTMNQQASRTISDQENVDCHILLDHFKMNEFCSLIGKTEASIRLVSVSLIILLESLKIINISIKPLSSCWLMLDFTFTTESCRCQKVLSKKVLKEPIKFVYPINFCDSQC